MILDIIVVLVVAFGFFAGYSRGLIKTIFDTLSLVIGILAAMKLSPIVINVLDGMLSIEPYIINLVGIVITFIFVMWLIRFVGKKLESIFKAANINVINKLAGGALQGIFFAFLLSMLLWLLGNYKVIKPETIDNSRTYAYLEPLPEAGKAVFTKVKPIFQSFWEKTVETMEQIGEKAEETQQESEEPK